MQQKSESRYKIEYFLFMAAIYLNGRCFFILRNRQYGTERMRYRKPPIKLMTVAMFFEFLRFDSNECGNYNDIVTAIILPTEGASTGDE